MARWLPQIADVNALSLEEILLAIEALPQDQQRRLQGFAAHLDDPARLSRAQFAALVRAFQNTPQDSPDAGALWSLIERALNPPRQPAVSADTALHAKAGIAAAP